MKNKIDRDRRTNLAKGISLDVSDDPKGSDDARRSEVASSDLEGCHPDDMKFREHLKKFFKGEK
tara:strand:+ start:281 stop:472 length:192 start_codon:yes stop_codon:yes gene_type:complete